MFDIWLVLFSYSLMPEKGFADKDISIEVTGRMLPRTYENDEVLGTSWKRTIERLASVFYLRSMTSLCSEFRSAPISEHVSERCVEQMGGRETGVDLIENSISLDINIFCLLNKPHNANHGTR